MADTAPASKLTARQRQFCAEYIIDLNSTQAAIRAGFSAKTANRAGPRLLSNVGVQAEIQRLMAERSARTQITADEVLRRLHSIAKANASELIEYRRTCCRWCYGVGHRYQRTAGELERDQQQWERAISAAHRDGTPPPGPFDRQGGAGFDPRKMPHPDCPECFGEGIGQAFVHDTRLLSEDAARLYAGVKVTRDSIEVKMRDQDAALLNLGRHLKLFTDKHDHEHHGSIPITTIRVPTKKGEAKAKEGKDRQGGTDGADGADGAEAGGGT